MPCSSETALTGRGGCIKINSEQVARVTSWSVNPTLASTSEWGDSDSAGYTNRTIGRRDATFTAEGKYDTGSSAYDLFDLGATVNDGTLSALLFMNCTDIGECWYFPCCICTDFSMTVDVDTEEVIGWSASFGADGIFHRPGSAEARSAAQP